jgi:hypothetical protein
MSEIERVTRLLRQVMKRKTTPKYWGAFVEQVAEDEVDDVGELQTVVRDLCGCSFVIEYVDAKDQESVREIEVRHLGYFGEALALNAYCKVRLAHRNFLAERIAKMVDLQTGEVIDAPYQWLRDLSGQNPTAEALERCAPGLQILSCLAWCDGQMSEAEFDVMVRYVDTCAGCPEIRWDVVETFVRSVRPSLSAYDSAVKRLKFQGYDESRRIASAARKLVLSDGVLAQEEAELMQGLQAFLGD